LKSLRIKGTRVFEETYNSTSRIVVNQGGTRSSKTYSVCQVMICKALQTTGKVFTICRKTGPSLKATVYRDFFEIIEGLGMYSRENHFVSKGIYVLNGNEFEFVSVDEPMKIRGRKRNYLMMNEANEFTTEDWQQLILRTTEQAYLDYNPSDQFHWIYDRVLTRDDCYFIKSTYLDNPFLSAETIKEIERLKDIDENYWKIYGLGEVGLVEGLIYPKFNLVDSFPECKWVVRGMDFGYTNDPTVIIKIGYSQGELYYEEEVHRTHLTNQDIIEVLKEKEVSRTDVIYADSAEPKSIEEIYRGGFNIKPCRKGADSIKQGIDVVKRYPMNITKNSTNLIKELRSYKWQTDKEGKNINKPVGFNDHCCDAFRYGVSMKLGTPKKRIRITSF
jgi:phage terminase large subunit